MTFSAFLVVSLLQLSPMGPAKTNVAIPMANMEVCEAYLKIAKEEVKAMASFQIIGGDVSCAPAEQLETPKPAEPGKPV